MTDERKIMIDAHPGGIPLTERLLALGGMDSREKGRKLLDLGAGKGESTEFLRNKGWDARGIDLVCPENSEVVIEMDMRRLEYDASSFDVCLAECSLSGCGDGAAALKEGYRVLKAYDGIQAIEMLKKEEVHLLVIDVMMPRMDGIRATLKIREESSIPIIILSAKGEDYDKVLGLNVGADDYVTKPFNPLELIAR